MSPLVLMTLLSAAPDTFLTDYAETRGFNNGRPTKVKVTPDGGHAVYLRSDPRGLRQVLYSADLATGAETVLLTPEQVLGGAGETLSTEERARLERMRVSARGITSYELSADGATLLLSLSGRLYVVDRASRKVTPLPARGGPAIDPRFSPDGKKVGFVRDHDVYVVDLATLKETRVSTGGTETRPNGTAEFVAQEEMKRYAGYWFSPDGQQVVYQRTDTSGVEKLGIPQPMHPEAEVVRFAYPRPGKPNAVVSLVVQPLDGRPAVPVKWDAATYPYLATVRWENGPLTLVVQDRPQVKEQVLAVDPATGKSTVLLTETDDAWLNLRQVFPLWWEGQGFFWGTERNGALEVELRRPDGTLATSWVKPDAGADQVVGFDPRTRTLLFTGEPDPTRKAVYAVVDGGAPQRLSEPGPAVETASLTGGDAYLVVSRSTPKSLPVTSVRRLDGTTVRTVRSVAVEPDMPTSQEIFSVPVEGGMYAEVTRPAGLVKGQKYPVILSVYGGPTSQVVTSTRGLLKQWMANQGFIVVAIDGRGTPRRGRAWERAVKGDFATLIAKDQLAGLAAVAQRVPELDLTRVGVYGWSFGGYLAALLGLAHGDVVKSAVAGAPVVDWLDYDTHYTERYLGVPGLDGKHPAYRVSSLLSYVDRARRPLLLVHGTSDDNVYFLHTLKLSDALFRAGAPHSVLPLANYTHFGADPVVTRRLYERIIGWFRETL